MKKLILLILIIFITVLAGYQIFFPLTSHQHQESGRRDIYYCPMHPQITSDKPGTCPICLMKLVRKESQEPGAPKQMSSTEAVSGYTTVLMDAHKQQLIGIKTASVTKQTLVKTIQAYGYVAHDLELYEAQLEYIEAWQTYYAFVVRRPVTDEFRQDWRQYYVKEPAQSRWRSDEKRKAQERLVKAEYELIHMGLTPAELEQLRKIKYGQPWVQPDLLFFENDRAFWIYAQILESDLGFIAPSQKVIATIPTYGETAEGEVVYVAPFIDPVTRTSRVRIKLSNYKGELSVNMYVNVEMPVELNDTLVVPREAIMDTGLAKIVFVQTPEGAFDPRDIQTGLEGDGMVTVKSGLKEGERIVVSGNFLLDSESRLQASLAGASSTTGGHKHD